MSRTNAVLHTETATGTLAVRGTGKTAQENRLPVDVGQTGFFEGREFRTFRRLNIPTGQTRVFRVVVPLNIILTRLQVELIGGQVELITLLGGTPSGTFDTTLPVIPANTMTEVPDPHTPEVVITTGATAAHTGGTELDVVMIKTADNSNFAAAVEGGNLARGVAADTYFIKVVNTDGAASAVGVLRARWEERP